jgi:hypothetical protein
MNGVLNRLSLKKQDAQVMCLRKSKRVGFRTLAILSVGAMGMYAQDSEREMERFGLGQRLGDCLVKGCEVFTGIIQSLGKLEKEPGEADEERAVMTRKVDLKVGEWLYAKGNGDAAHLIYAARPALTKTSLGPWSAWEGTTLDIGGQLLVVRWAKEAPRPTWLGKPDDVAFVLSDKSLFASVREAIAQHRSLEHNPDEAAKIPQLLRDKQDSVFKGYLLTYLMNGEGVRDVDKAAAMLSGLLGHESVPGPARAAIADWLASTFYRLTEATRKTATEALVVSASADDARAANPALSVLVRLGDLQMLDLKPLLTQARQRKIVENYRNFRAQNKVQQEHPEFELQLGLR